MYVSHRIVSWHLVDFEEDVFETTYKMLFFE